jgi:hypothetical protein
MLIAMLVRSWIDDRRRRKVAAGLERVVADAGRVRWTSAAPFDLLAVQEARGELTRLAGELRNRDVNRAAVDIAQWILTNWASPLYDGRRGQGLRETAHRAALTALG